MQEPFEDDYETEEISDAVKSSLSKMKVNELKSFAEEHGIDISGLKAKPDLVDAIALYPGIARILEDEHEVPEEEETLPSFLQEEPEEAPPEEPEEPEPETRVPALSERVKQALKASVDFSTVEHYLSEAATKFKERNYDAAVQTAKDSVFKIEEKVSDFVEASWAFAIASAQRILDTSNKSSKAAKEAKRCLDEATEAFKDSSFIRAPEILQDLGAAALNLYSYEMDRAREHVASQEKALEDVKAMGGDVATASTMLSRAAEALGSNHRASYLDMIAEANTLVERARHNRIGEIKEAADSVDSVIQEASSIGADVGEASRLIEDVRRAIDSEDFVSADDLVAKAEQVALQSQKSHIDRVSQMRDQQIEKVKDLIGQIKPLIDKAKTQGLQAGEAVEDLRAAVEHVNAGDYVNALLRAKRSYQAVKAFKSKQEAKELETTTIKAEETVEVKGAEPVEEPAEEPETTCVHCGSKNVDVGSRGKARCMDCGKKFRV